MQELYILMSAFGVGLVTGYSLGTIETQDRWLWFARLIGISFGAIVMLLLVLIFAGAFT